MTITNDAEATDAVITPASDAVRYAAAITAQWRSLPPVNDARKLRSDILKALELLARYDTRSLDVSRANVRHLIRLVSLVRPEDLAASGGLLGASNAWYAERLGVRPDTMTTIFRALKRAGLIIPHNQTENHRRVARRDRHTSWIGRGYSLKPLLVRLPEFSQQGRRLEHEAVVVRAKLFELDALIRQMRRQLAAAPDDGLHERLASIADEMRAAGGRPSAPLATSLLHQAFVLSLDVEKRLQIGCAEAPCPDLNPDQSRKNSGPHITAEQHDTVLVSAIQEGGSGEDGAPTAISGVRERLLVGEEMTCGITPAEARHLFPAGALFIPASSDHEAFVISASRLSDALKINPRLLGRGFETMGIARTMWSLFIVCQRSARGEIHATPAAYFNGMVTKAAAGMLDLDRSIWGERQKANNHMGG
ncbi:replication initiation protein RepC [Novosphingobium sp. MD-1]|uniref:replication initiation protein RepC n=1 Tax=Novosphingobium sp. MD-1 TaxID=1630648 RepID=UPI00061C8951|nr:replication initiation protein RepC [Novosphingobium sp. MD-1]GAO52896.1 hypothetical protein NMD1_00863 [Novosphingobium sp. MD-1]